MTFRWKKREAPPETVDKTEAEEDEKPETFWSYLLTKPDKNFGWVLFMIAVALFQGALGIVDMLNNDGSDGFARLLLCFMFLLSALNIKLHADHDTFREEILASHTRVVEIAEQLNEIAKHQDAELQRLRAGGSPASYQPYHPN